LSRPPRLESVLAAAVAVLVHLAALAWACGPFFPAWLLGRDERVLESPVGLFDKEVERVLPRQAPPFRAVLAAESPFRQTATVDRDDLEKALTAAGVSTRQRTDLLAAHERLREAILWAVDPEPEQTMREEGTAPPPPPLPALAVPEGLPGEFRDYLRGAVAHHQRRPDEARGHWMKLLERPAGERRFRSTWAAFMLGKSSLEQDPGGAVRWFERTRELAGEGFADNLGLAAASLGWQARAELNRGNHARALELYAEQARAGDPTALNSLRFASAKALNAGSETLRKVALDADARRLVTAYVVSPRGRPDFEIGASYPEARTWLEAIRAAGIRDVEGADRLAWAAYLGGDFEAAGQWAERAPEGSPLALWVRAKLLLRAGKLAEAERLLAETTRAITEADLSQDDAYYRAYEDWPPLATGSRAHGEEGAVRLARQDYVPALAALLRSGYWLDAAYVAERVLTLEELRAHVDKNWPADLAARYQPGEYPEPYAGGLVEPPEERLAYDLRYLLGRRLARAGRYQEARPYLPETLRPKLDELAAASASGTEARRAAAERAQALFRAACVMRQQGMELLGTEIEPDWSVFQGSYDPEFITAERETREGRSVIPESPDEKQRERRHRVSPWKRFHYRYRAAALAREAAALLPDGSPEKARFLAVAGSWLKGRDPEAARPLYDELVRCCPETGLGRQAVERRWFPEVEGCE
jgi:hypothetical protein